MMTKQLSKQKETETDCFKNRVCKIPIRCCIIFGRDIVSLPMLCYNKTDEKASI